MVIPAFVLVLKTSGGTDHINWSGLLPVMMEAVVFAVIITVLLRVTRFVRRRSQRLTADDEHHTRI
jgi:hypothetical protein